MFVHNAGNQNVCGDQLFVHNICDENYVMIFFFFFWGGGGRWRSGAVEGGGVIRNAVN